VTVRSLRTNFVIGAGTPTSVSGVGEAVTGSADGTLQRLDEPLRRGDSYTVRSYVPTPTAAEMRRAPARYDAQLAEYTRIVLPRPGEDALRAPRAGGGLAARDRVSVPLVGTRFEEPEVRRRLAASPYARAQRLARSLTAGAPTVYDAVRRVRDHFRGNGFVYSERPPSRRFPLESFLFTDKTGYCQQYSGAMALLLRMAGIPARVVAGFSPGSLNRDTGAYRVRDLDAHSWVEVYFAGIGWVTFDPTPPAAPADRAGQGPDAARAGRVDANDALTRGGDAPASDRTTDTRGGGAGARAAEGDGGAPGWVVALLVLGALGGAGGLVLRRRAPAGGDPAEAGLLELERALPRLGWKLTAGTTLLQLERRLGRGAGPASARYVAALRAGRFARGGVANPSPADRRAMRRELTASGGVFARLRGWVALPPRGRPS
jgi:transglutaminase-like putative cysteine protease